MKKLLIIFSFLVSFFIAVGQIYKSERQSELEFFNKIGDQSPEFWKNYFRHKKIDFVETKGCKLERVVFGWHPYWANGLEDNYQWSYLSDLAYFAYEVDYSTGDPVSLHGWETASVVEDAKSHGVRVHLTATLFGNHDAFFGNSTAVQNLIDNLVTQILSRNADGINIDFEGMGSDNRDQFVQFIANLRTAMDQQDTNWILSICLYAVDWNDVFDIQSLNQYVDYYTIMGYDYYYSGSSYAGPTGQLYTLSSFNYNESRSVTYYLHEGVPKEKLILGVPYYGFDWPTQSSSIPSSTTASGSTKFYKVFKSNYSNPQLEPNSRSTVKVYYDNTNSTWRQCWVDDETAMAYKYKMVLQQDIAGIAIWALSYDDGYTELWDLIRDYFSQCAVVPCSDTIWDLGGPGHSYYNNEDFIYTIQPLGAQGLSLEFIDFSLEAGYDSLYIYDGNSVNSPLIGGYSGTNSPGIISASGNALTIRFFSDGATVDDGWTAVWHCNSDNQNPVTQINAPEWVSADFQINFSDDDNIAVKDSFYLIADYSASEWRANEQFGFLNDNFDISVNQEWTQVSGNWFIQNGFLRQDDESLSNTNLYINLYQDTLHKYLYSWKMRISGSGSNRRAGFHFFCDDPAQSGRHNSYMVYFRCDNNTAQIYKYIDNTYNLMTSEPCNINENEWYDYKVIFDPATGEIYAFKNDTLVASWIDPDPWTEGGYVSLRAGNCIADYDDFRVYKSRTFTEAVMVGNGTGEIRTQNPSMSQPAGLILSLVTDANDNFSDTSMCFVNVDFTPPQAPNFVNDGIADDLDTSYSASQLSANWAQAVEDVSFIKKYWIAIGSTPGNTDICSWTQATTQTHYTVTDLNLTYGQTYYFAVKAENAAGLFSDVTVSDGITILQPQQPPVADFTASDTQVCSPDTLLFSANTEDVDSYFWYFEGGSPEFSEIPNPEVVYEVPGTFDVKLKVCNLQGCDSVYYSDLIKVADMPAAQFSASPLSGSIPLTVVFSDESQNAADYVWDFGDGYSSSEVEPVHIYLTQGTYTVSLTVTNEFCSDTETKENYITAEAANIFVNNNLEIYPNPATSYIILENCKKACDFYITTTDGKVLLNGTYMGKIDISPLASGYYLLFIINKKQTHVYKFEKK